MKTILPKYDRNRIKAGILHFGVGNFHRAHEEYYTNRLLAEEGQENWGICGVILHESGKQKYEALRSQDGIYGLTVFSEDGEDAYYRIGSLVELFWGPSDMEKIIQKIADPQIKIISLTITEGGYCLNQETGEFCFQDKEIIHDLQFSGQPRTVFGCITAGLKKRIEEGGSPVTILSCDNLRHNGDVCKKAFLSYFEKADKDVFQWAKKNVGFPNSMVDRITPAVSQTDKERLAELNGYEDLAPVYCEGFAQWVIEDHFPGGRPDWEQAGVQFTDDVSKYETMKLSLVNAPHQMLSFPAFLAGYRNVDEAMEDARIEALVRQFMKRDVIPYLEAPPETDLEQYGETFIKRLKNKRVSDQIARLCFDAANKNPVYILPRIAVLIENGGEMERAALFVAAYRLYLRRGTDDKGNAYTIEEPGLTEADYGFIQSEEPKEFLRVGCFAGFGLEKSREFLTCYLKMCRNIEKNGVMAEMEKLAGEGV